MTDLDLFSIHPYVVWLVAGLALCAAETFVPGAFLIWIGLAAVALGGIEFFVAIELTPALLVAFGGSGAPDAALAAFDAALSHMLGAVELLSILRSNAPVRELFGDLLGGAPRLAASASGRSTDVRDASSTIPTIAIDASSTALEP